MEYSEVQSKILIATNKLNSVVAIDSYDYTHIPNVDHVVNSINDLICALQNVQDQIINKEQF